MSTFKKKQVVMLSTNEKAPLQMRSNKGDHHPKYPKGYLAFIPENVRGALDPERYWENQHLYILSDDEIKEGDWYITQDGKLLQCKKVLMGLIYADGDYGRNKNSVKKIIATTDESIKLPYDGKTSISENWGGYALPQPSEGFLDVYVDFYNRGKPITEVMVEYRQNTFVEFYDNKEQWSELPKVNTTDNTITIKKVKDSWTRDEVRHLMTQSYLKGIDRELDDFNNLIEENL